MLVVDLPIANVPPVAVAPQPISNNVMFVELFIFWSAVIFERFNGVCDTPPVVVAVNDISVPICIKLVTAEYRSKNREKLNEKNRLYREKVKDPNYVSVPKVKLTEEEKRRKRSEYTVKYISERSKVDPLFKLKNTIRSSISRTVIDYLKYNNLISIKKSSTESILGISYNEFKTYIEEQFIEGMSWENYGEWQFDHKTPISWANTEDEVYELNHYTNFQPLWTIENQIKGSRYKSI